MELCSKMNSECFENVDIQNKGDLNKKSEQEVSFDDICDEPNETIEKIQNISINESASSESETQKFERSLQSDLLDFVAQSDAHFKSQQIGDPDLTFQEKRNIADEILKKNPAIFLARFGTNIKPKHLEYFTSMNDDYEVDFYIKKLERFHSKKFHDFDIKNRRYEALQKLVSEGSYFSEEEMKRRNPLLFEELIGQYLSEDERKERAKDLSKMTYLSYLLDRMDRDSTNDLHKKQLEEEEGATEENDSDFDESCDSNDGEIEREVTAREKDVLRQEFVCSMYRSFLEGKDTDFDYSSVDFNVEYDNHRDMDQDDEEKYFDSETPESVDGDKECVEMADDVEDELDTYMNTLA